MKVQTSIATIVHQQFDFGWLWRAFTLGFVFFVCSHSLYVSHLRYTNQEKSEKR